MAKLQKATLDPTQVSGRCGRLKCCLRYEHIGYEELDKQLPRNGIRILTSHGNGVVVNRQVLTQLVQIRKDDGTRLTVVAEDILEVGVSADALPPPPEPVEEKTVTEKAPAKEPTKTRSNRRRSGRRERGGSSGAAQPPKQRQAGTESGEPNEQRESKQPSEGSNDKNQRRNKRRGRRRRGRRRPPNSNDK